MKICNKEQALVLGQKMEEYLNGTDGTGGFFKYPIRVEMEKAMRILVVHKKMYAYLQYAPGTSEFLLDKNERLFITSKGILTARRDICNACKKAFGNLLLMVMTRVDPRTILLSVADNLKEFLTNTNVTDFTKTVEVAGHYISKFAPNSLFKQNMLKRGTKLEAKYVIVVTDAERSGKAQSRVGDKMLLVKYFDPEVHQVDIMYYLDHFLKNPLDNVVSSSLAHISKSIKVATAGKPIFLNRPADAIIKLVSTCNRRCDIGGLHTYKRLVNSTVK